MSTGLILWKMNLVTLWSIKIVFSKINYSHEVGKRNILLIIDATWLNFF